jgi:hypothetical protein
MAGIRTATRRAGILLNGKILGKNQLPENKFPGICSFSRFALVNCRIGIVNLN